MSGEPTERSDFIRLALAVGIGPSRLRNLLAVFGSPTAVLKAVPATLAKVDGIGEINAHNIHKTLEFDLDDFLSKLPALDIQLFTWDDEDYPQLLLTIDDPPPLLFVKGNADFSIPAIAIVGTRHATPYGLRVAAKLARDLVAKGMAVISGLALGIDGAAHRGALDGGGITWGVLGCGLDMVYPISHKNLAEEMVAAGGALISSYPIGVAPSPGNFPARNRIISGMALGVVVVEAPERSGALITAREALEQGREVFAVPGSIDSVGHRGTHNLLRQGAHLVENVDDIFNEIAAQIVTQYGKRPASGIGSVKASKGNEASLFALKELDAGSRRIIEQLGDDPIHADELSRMLGMPPGELAMRLVDLELSGLIAKQPGNTYIRNI
jgi:DNA processing protein